MGEVIRKSAAAEDIFGDVRTTYAQAVARGGVWKTLAEDHLARVAELVEAVNARARAANAAVVPLNAALAAQDEASDFLLGRISDEIWNLVGRPGNDPALSILFPGGFAYYAEGNTEEQPDRMLLLAELLETGIHPKLSVDAATSYAKQIRESAAALQSALGANRLPRARAGQLNRVVRAVATAAQAELSALKRRYRAERFSEAEIHAVIPDRPAATVKNVEPAPDTLTNRS